MRNLGYFGATQAEIAAAEQVLAAATTAATAIGPCGPTAVAMSCDPSLSVRMVAAGEALSALQAASGDTAAAEVTKSKVATKVATVAGKKSKMPLILGAVAVVGIGGFLWWKSQQGK